MKTILIIEDDPTVRASIQDCLEAQGFRTLVANNGQAGVQVSQAHLPDLVLCDVQMPGVSGYDVLQTLRQAPTTATIPFIFLTGKQSKADWRFGMELGADDYLTKPFGPQDLLRAVDSRLHKHAAVESHHQQQMEHLRHNIALSLPHELRTPITSILTSAELLRYTADDPTQVLELADTIQSATERLYELVQNFLLYADLEIAVRDPQRAQQPPQGRIDDPAALIAIAATKVAQNQDRLPDLHLDLHLDLPLNLPSRAIAMPEAALLKIIDILLDNACKFSDPGTPIHIRSSNSSTGFLIQITDHGRGMTAQQIAQVGAYMQFDRRRHEQQGTGLGLIIAHRLAELHGGALTIHSLPGEQTTVQVLCRSATVKAEL